MMRRSTLSFGFVLMFATCLAACCHGETAYFKVADGTWRPLPCRVMQGKLSFVLDPTQIQGGSTIVVLAPPQGINLQDTNPPQVTGVKVDGLPCKNVPHLALDWLATHPQKIAIGLWDRENPLDPDSLTVQVNGKSLPPAQRVLQFTSQDRHEARLVLHLLRNQAEIINTIQVRIADLSPERNSVTRTLTYRCLEVVKEDPTLVVDSCCQGYENLSVLVDGKTMEPGKTTFGCTWASAEEPGDHWLVMAWPQAREVRSVEISWANYDAVYWASRLLLVQSWDGQKWVTQKTLKDNQPTPSTKVDFGPVKTARIRLLQPDGMGHPGRPDIMWLCEVKVQ